MTIEVFLYLNTSSVNKTIKIYSCTLFLGRLSTGIPYQPTEHNLAAQFSRVGGQGGGGIGGMLCPSTSMFANNYSNKRK